MSIFNDKALKGVAEAAAKIMEAEKKAKMDYDKDGKVESPKAEVLGSRIRAAKMAGKLKEEEELDEAKKPMSQDEKDKVVGAVQAAMRKSRGNVIAGQAQRAAARLAAKVKHGMKEEVELNEETEQLQEYESKGGKYTHKGTYGREKGAKYGESDYSKGGEEEKEIEKVMKSPKRASKGYGARQNYKRSTRVNESLSFTEMLQLYNEEGLKILAPVESEELELDSGTIDVIDADKINGVVETIVEEPTEEEFNKELADQKASAEGKKKQPPVAAGKTIGVKNMPESVELDERTLTAGETKKKEHYVKSMKKGLSGFKARYGDRAKSVMYATATKMAKKD